MCEKLSGRARAHTHARTYTHARARARAHRERPVPSDSGPAAALAAEGAAAAASAICGHAGSQSRYTGILHAEVCRQWSRLRSHTQRRRARPSRVERAGARRSRRLPRRSRGGARDGGVPLAGCTVHPNDGLGRHAQRAPPCDSRVGLGEDRSLGHVLLYLLIGVNFYQSDSFLGMFAGTRNQSISKLRIDDFRSIVMSFDWNPGPFAFPHVLSPPALFTPGARGRARDTQTRTAAAHAHASKRRDCIGSDRTWRCTQAATRTIATWGGVTTRP